MIVVLMTPAFEPTDPKVFGVFPDVGRASETVKKYDPEVTDWMHSSGYEYCYSVKHTFKMVQVEPNKAML